MTKVLWKRFLERCEHNPRILLMHNFIDTPSCMQDSTELNLTEHLKRKSLLILVYIEAVYMLFPGYPHHPPTVTLEVVNRVDEVNVTVNDFA